MPELPEIANRAKEMQEHLTGKQIASIEIVQPKCLNIAPEDFQKYVGGADNSLNFIIVGNGS